MEQQALDTAMKEAEPEEESEAFPAPPGAGVGMPHALGEFEVAQAKKAAEQ